LRPHVTVSYETPPTWRARNRVAQLYRGALDSLFVASYDSQGYGGGILSRFHTGILQLPTYPAYNTSARTAKERQYLIVVLLLLIPQSFSMNGSICHNMYKIRYLKDCDTLPNQDLRNADKRYFL
jgi:hypothetical protein